LKGHKGDEKSVSHTRSEELHEFKPQGIGCECRNMCVVDLLFTMPHHIVGHGGSVVAGSNPRFKSHASRHVGTLGKSFTRSLKRFGVLNPTQYQCCTQERLLVVGLKRCYRNIRNERM